MNKIDEYIKKIEKTKREAKFDLSKDEDLSIAVMNLVSIEEHFFFTAKKTGKDKYLDLFAEVRKIRHDLMKKLVKSPEGELWCISKHLLAASMRLIEVGSKELSSDNKKVAGEMFEKSYNLYSLFWGLNLGLIESGEVKKIDSDKLDSKDKDSKSLFARLGSIVRKAVDCCIEN